MPHDERYRTCCYVNAVCCSRVLGFAWMNGGSHSCGALFGQAISKPFTFRATGVSLYKQEEFMAQAVTTILRQQLTQEQQAMLMWPLLIYAAKLQHVLSYSDVESFTGIMAVGQHEALGKIYDFCE